MDRKQGNASLISMTDLELIEMQAKRMYDLETVLQNYKVVLADMLLHYPDIIYKYSEQLIKAEEPISLEEQLIEVNPL